MKLIICENLFEEVKTDSNLDDIISSFEPKDTLNPILFLPNQKLKPKVRELLLKISAKFYETLKIEGKKYTDIILTGSNANYNWSSESDVDLHLIIPFEEISDNFGEEYFKAKKELWNEMHDIKIKTHEVEMYVQSEVEDGLVANGIYSVLFDHWIKKPSQMDVDIDREGIMRIYQKFQNLYNQIYKLYSQGDYGKALDMAEMFWDRLKAMRMASLQKGGEFSSGNLAFKLMRRANTFDNLDSIQSEMEDAELSIGVTPKTNQFSKGKGKGDGEDFGNRVRKKDMEDNISPVDRKDADIDPLKVDKPTKGMGRYLILGRRFRSLRQAERVLGIPKSTIAYRLANNDKPEYSQYKKL